MKSSRTGGKLRFSTPEAIRVIEHAGRKPPAAPLQWLKIAIRSPICAISCKCGRSSPIQKTNRSEYQRSRDWGVHAKEPGGSGAFMVEPLPPQPSTHSVGLSRPRLRKILADDHQGSLIQKHSIRSRQHRRFPRHLEMPAKDRLDDPPLGRRRHGGGCADRGAARGGCRARPRLRPLSRSPRSSRSS